MRRSLSRALAAAVVIVSGTTAVMWAAGRGDTAEAAASQVVLDDDFSGNRGGRPDAAVWTVGDGRGMVWLDGDGRLALGSALRTAKAFEQASGRAEARIKMDRTDGAWRALGVFDASGRVLDGRMETLAPDRVSSSDFHTYAIDWTPAALTWSVDGREVLRFTPQQQGQPKVFVLNSAGGMQYSGGVVVDSVKITVQVPTTPAPTASAAQWKTFAAYKAGDLVKYREVVYRVREAHTSLPDWKPDLVPALFEKA